jgi:hypothetical protein
MNKHDQRMARLGLLRAYEATEQYELALEQANWLIQRAFRNDVLIELNITKQSLEKRLADQKTVAVVADYSLTNPFAQE